MEKKFQFHKNTIILILKKAKNTSKYKRNSNPCQTRVIFVFSIVIARNSVEKIYFTGSTNVKLMKISRI
jgi:hypothetical protein